jgi:hypothetical protein
MAADFFKRAKALFVKEPPPPAAETPRKVPQKFHAVSIVPGVRACSQAQALQGQRFLSSEAPPLPLKKCDYPRCQCRYEHHEDRRKGNRRAHDLSVSIDGYAGTERRETAKRGRRKTDR